MGYRFVDLLLLLIAGTGCSAAATSNLPTWSMAQTSVASTNAPLASPTSMMNAVTPLSSSIPKTPTPPTARTLLNTATPDPFSISKTPATTAGCFQTSPSTSPDKRTAVYSAGGNPLAIVLRDVASGTERRLILEGGTQDAQAGSFVWSDDSSVLMLTLVVHPCDPAHWLYSIVRVETATMTQKTLIRNQTRVVKTVRWKAPAIVWLEDANGNTWMIDAETGGSPTL